MYTNTGYITPTAPYDFAKSLNFLGFFSPTQGEQAITEQALTKAVYVDGQLLAFLSCLYRNHREPRWYIRSFLSKP